MKKKILIGSLLVLTLLLLMPSIPAIQQKTIEDKAYGDFNLEDIELINDIKFPIIYNFLCVYILNRVESLDRFFDFLLLILPNGAGSPIFQLLFICIAVRLDFFRDILQEIAIIRGWNWDLPEVIHETPWSK